MSDEKPTNLAMIFVESELAKTLDKTELKKKHSHFWKRGKSHSSLKQAHALFVLML